MRIVNSLVYDTISSLDLKSHLHFLNYFEKSKTLNELAPKVILKRSSACPLAKSLTVHCYYNIDSVDTADELNLHIADIISTFTCDYQLPVLSSSFIQLPSVHKTIAVNNSIELNYILKCIYTMLFCKERDMCNKLKSEIAKISLSSTVTENFNELLQTATDTIISNYRTSSNVFHGTSATKSR